MYKDGLCVCGGGCGVLFWQSPNSIMVNHCPYSFLSSSFYHAFEDRFLISSAAKFVWSNHFAVLLFGQNIVFFTVQGVLGGFHWRPIPFLVSRSWPFLCTKDFPSQQLPTLSPTCRKTMTDRVPHKRPNSKIPPHTFPQQQDVFRLGSISYQP